MERFLTRGWDLIFPSGRRLYEAQVGVSAPSGAVSARGTTIFRPRFVETVHVLEGFLMRGWDKFPRWHWLHRPQKIINSQQVELGFPNRDGRYQPGRGTAFVPGSLELYIN